MSSLPEPAQCREGKMKLTGAEITKIGEAFEQCLGIDAGDYHLDGEPQRGRVEQFVDDILDIIGAKDAKVASER